MFEEMSRTLAILKLPKGDPRNGTVFDRPMSHIDFVPLFVAAAGLPEWPGFQGRAPWSRPIDTPVYMTVNALVRENSVVRWPWKFMSRTFPVVEHELYDLQNDPEERRNLVRSNPEVATQLAGAVAAWRTCQISYYNDSQAYSRLQPPRFN
jgi:arylsulfatase A-like enzyme